MLSTVASGSAVGATGRLAAVVGSVLGAAGGSFITRKIGRAGGSGSETSVSKGVRVGGGDDNVAAADIAGNPDKGSARGIADFARTGLAAGAGSAFTCPWMLHPRVRPTTIPAVTAARERFCCRMAH